MRQSPLQQFRRRPTPTPEQAVPGSFQSLSSPPELAPNRAPFFLGDIESWEDQRRATQNDQHCTDDERQPHYFGVQLGRQGVTEKAKHFELLTKTIHASVEREPLSENAPSSRCHSRDD